MDANEKKRLETLGINWIFSLLLSLSNFIALCIVVNNLQITLNIYIYVLCILVVLFCWIQAMRYATTLYVLRVCEIAAELNRKEEWKNSIEVNKDL